MPHFKVKDRIKLSELYNFDSIIGVVEIPNDTIVISASMPLYINATRYGDNPFRRAYYIKMSKYSYHTDKYIPIDKKYYNNIILEFIDVIGDDRITDSTIRVKINHKII